MESPLPTLVLSLLFYHISEPTLTYIYNRSDLSLSSLLLSPPYLLAMTLGLLEFFVLPHPAQILTYYPGVFLIILGECIRKTAWLTARHSFNHRLQTERKQGHVLVTWGIYRYTRHPSYTGWFLWAIGTQVLLGNCVCALGFGIVAWRFFRTRVEIEEYWLEDMFGSEWLTWKERTWSGLPAIA